MMSSPEKAETRRFGFWSAVLLGMNGIIGSGIYLLPGRVAGEAGHMTFLVYLFAFVLVSAITRCFAWCASIFGRNGGCYVYAAEAFGGLIGFEMGIMRWALCIIAWATLAAGFVAAFSSIWPEALLEPTRSFFVAGLIMIPALLNCAGIEIFKYLNNIFTLIKLLPLFLFIGIGIFYTRPEHFSIVLPRELHLESFESFGSAVLLVFYAFGGFETLPVAAGEIENPKKNLPRILAIVIIFCSFLYIVIQFIAVGLLGEALKTSVSPIADAAQILFGDGGRWVATLSMLISIGGINFAASFISPLMGVTLAEDGIFPKWLAVKNRLNKPIRAILLTAALTMCVALSGSFVKLAVISVIARFAQYICTCAAVIALYRQGRMPDVKNGRMIVAVPCIALVGMLWLLSYASFDRLAWGLGSLVIGIPFYYLRRYRMKVA